MRRPAIILTIGARPLREVPDGVRRDREPQTISLGSFVLWREGWHAHRPTRGGLPLADGRLAAKTRHGLFGHNDGGPIDEEGRRLVSSLHATLLGGARPPIRVRVVRPNLENRFWILIGKGYPR